MIVLPGRTYIDSYWDSEGLKSSAAANEVLADTGELAAGFYDFRIFFTHDSTTERRCAVQHRNAANSANIQQQLIELRAFSQVGPMELLFFKIAQDERIRFITIESIGNYVQASIHWVRIY